MSELKPRITENGIDYILVGDYYIPDLKLPEEHRPIQDKYIPFYFHTLFYPPYYARKHLQLPNPTLLKIPFDIFRNDILMILLLPCFPFTPINYLFFNLTHIYNFSNIFLGYDLTFKYFLWNFYCT